MTLIGPRFFSPPGRPTAASGSNHQTPISSLGNLDATNEPQGDGFQSSLLQIHDGGRAISWKNAARHAGTFALKNGLALVGGAVAGVPGLLAGAALSGAVQSLENSDKTASQRLLGGLTHSLKTAALAGGLGLTSLAWAPLGPILQASIAGASTLAAGIFQYGAERQKLDFNVDVPNFTKAYQAKAQQNLEAAGLPNALQKLPNPWAVTKEAKVKKAQVQLAQMAAVVNHHLGPAVAVGIAHEIGRQRFDSGALSALAPKPFESRTQSVQVIDEVEVQRVLNFSLTENTPGMAVYEKVMLDSQLEPGNGNTLADFVVGHEISHVKNHDSSATLAHLTLTEAIKETKDRTNSTDDQMVLTKLENDLQSAIFANSREMEFRADQDGLRHALQQGHSPESVLNAARELFGENSTDDLYRNHPAADKRLEALRASLENRVP